MHTQLSSVRTRKADPRDMHTQLSSVRTRKADPGYKSLENTNGSKLDILRYRLYYGDTYIISTGIIQFVNHFFI